MQNQASVSQKRANIDFLNNSRRMELDKKLIRFFPLGIWCYSETFFPLRECCGKLALHHDKASKTRILSSTYDPICNLAKKNILCMDRMWKVVISLKVKV